MGFVFERAINTILDARNLECSYLLKFYNFLCLENYTSYLVALLEQFYFDQHHN